MLQFQLDCQAKGFVQTQFDIALRQTFDWLVKEIVVINCRASARSEDVLEESAPASKETRRVSQFILSRTVNSPRVLRRAQNQYKQRLEVHIAFNFTELS